MRGPFNELFRSLQVIKVVTLMIRNLHFLMLSIYGKITAVEINQEGLNRVYSDDVASMKTFVQG